MLKDFEITRGLRHLSNSGSGSPPTLPQFLKACRQHDPDDVVRPGNTYALPPPGMDNYDAYGNRMLFAFLLGKQGVDERLVPQLVDAKNRVMGQCREIERDEEIPSEEIRAKLYRTWEIVLAANRKSLDARPRAEAYAR